MYRARRCLDGARTRRTVPSNSTTKASRPSAARVGPSKSRGAVQGNLMFRYVYVGLPPVCLSSLVVAEERYKRCGRLRVSEIPAKTSMILVLP